MQPVSRNVPVWPVIAWSVSAGVGLVIPAIALVLLANGSAHGHASTTPPVIAIAMMAGGMIAGAADGRFWFGTVMAALNGIALAALATILGALSLAYVIVVVIAIPFASVSFAARGALFARSGGARGWWIALFVVAGEAAIVLTALADPNALPAWLLALLPAQWASIAVGAAFDECGELLAMAPLIALAGTGAATMFVVALWPKRWTYAVMFTTWLAMSALVYHQHAAAL